MDQIVEKKDTAVKRILLAKQFGCFGGLTTGKFEEFFIVVTLIETD